MNFCTPAAFLGLPKAHPVLAPGRVAIVGARNGADGNPLGCGITTVRTRRPYWSSAGGGGALAGAGGAVSGGGFLSRDLLLLFFRRFFFLGGSVSALGILGSLGGRGGAGADIFYESFEKAFGKDHKSGALIIESAKIGA